jgi:hypothetical protein
MFGVKPTATGFLVRETLLFSRLLRTVGARSARKV